MNKTRRISGLLWALLFAWGSANAAGLGKLSVQSALGQPLRAEIELLSVTKDDLADISARLATAEAFKQARIDRQEVLGNLRFSVDQRSNGQPVIRISSTSSVQDPFLDMLIELNWSSGRLIREYTILLDPVASAKPADTVRSVPAVTPLISGATNGTTKPKEPAAAVETAKAKPAAPPPAPRTYGPVKSGETLRGIASKVRPADISLEQMMVGLYQANKQAFQNNNMNRLNRGGVLNVPSADAAQAVTRAEAARTVRGHTTEWNAYRRKLAEMAGEVPVTKVEDQAAGKITPQQDIKPAPAPGVAKDVLKLSKGEPGGAVKPDGKTQERLHAMEEELAAKGRALQEAQDRVSQLERTVRDMQKLLEMKAQEAAKAPPAPAPGLTDEQPAPLPEPVAEPTPAPVAEPAPVETPKPASVIAPLPVAEPTTSWVSTFISNPIYIGGIVAALLLSGLLWMMMVGSRRRQGLTKFEDSIMTGGEFKNNAVFNASSGNLASGASTEGSMLLTDFSRLGMGAIDSHEVDPIAEAEVYMAYGRDAQAEEILREALIKDPARYEIALKLLELYASRKDTTSFETTASELYAGLGGQNTPVWQRAAEMGRSIDPENPLYRVDTQQSGIMGAPATAAATVAAAATVVAAAATLPVESAAKNDLGDLLQLASMDDWGASEKVEAAKPDLEFASEYSSGARQPESAPAAAEGSMAFESAPVVPEASDFDTFANEEVGMSENLDLNPIEDFEPVATEAAEIAFPGSLTMPDELSLDFETAREVTQAVAEKPEPAQVALEKMSAPDLADFEFSEDLEATEIEAAGADEMPVLDLSGIDLDLEMESLPEAEEVTATSAAEAAEEIASIEVTEAPEFEMAADLEPEVEAVTAEAAEPELADGIDAELREEVNTKLDLARAYMEMGDREGAREILQEVLGEGDLQQKAEADKLLAEAG
jgi:pilus assembly protein FimV